MSIYEPHLCQVYWGSHGCGLPRYHGGGHDCDGDEIDRDGFDGSGYRWFMYGDDAVVRDNPWLRVRAWWGERRYERLRRHSFQIDLAGVSDDQWLSWAQDARGKLVELQTGTIRLTGFFDDGREPRP